jgi:hypothetical protein
VKATNSPKLVATIQLYSSHKESLSMPRYLVERTFPQGLGIAPTEQGAATCLTVVNNNAENGVTWVHSYVTNDKGRTYCIYDGPSPEAIRQSALQNGLPVDRITEVRVLDPYFYR